MKSEAVWKEQRWTGAARTWCVLSCRCRPGVEECELEDEECGWGTSPRSGSERKGRMPPEEETEERLWSGWTATGEPSAPLSQLRGEGERGEREKERRKRKDVIKLFQVQQWKLFERLSSHSLRTWGGEKVRLQTRLHAVENESVWYSHCPITDRSCDSNEFNFFALSLLQTAVQVFVKQARTHCSSCWVIFYYLF